MIKLTLTIDGSGTSWIIELFSELASKLFVVTCYGVKKLF